MTAAASHPEGPARVVAADGGAGTVPVVCKG